MTSLNMIRGRSNVATLTNNSGGALVAGDVCIQDTTGDEYATTTTSANSTKQVVIAAESIANGAAGKFYVGGYCPLVTPSASVTRGRYLFTHTVAKQAAESATYGDGAFGVALKSGTTPSVWLFGATGQAAGGGNATYESAYASPPATPAEGDTWFITDSRLGARYTGAAWSYYWGTRKVAPPGTTSWVNQGSATFADTGDITLYCPAGTGENLRGRVMTAPSLNYTIDVILIPAFLPATDSFGSYIVWSDGTKFVAFGIGNITSSGGPYLEVNKWNTATSFSASYGGGSNVEPFIRWIAKPIYLRIQEDGSNRTCSYS